MSPFTSLSRFGRTCVAALGLLACQVVTVHAQATPEYKVDTGASRVYIRVGTATRLGHSHGVEGKLASGKVAPGKTGELVFDMTSFVCDTAAARNYVGLGGSSISASDAQKATHNMRSNEVLDVGRHPQATCSLTSIVPMAGQKPGEAGPYRCTGRFLLHGVTQNIAFNATLQPGSQQGTLALRGQFSIMQTSYGIRPYSALGGLIRISDQLDIWGDLVLVPAQ